MKMAIQKQQVEGITISAPGSVFKTARSLMLQNRFPQNQSKQENVRKSWTEIAREMEFANNEIQSLNGEIIDL